MSEQKMQQRTDADGNPLVGITVHVRPELRKELRQMALDTDSSSQTIVEQAIRDAIAAHKKRRK